MSLSEPAVAISNAFYNDSFDNQTVNRAAHISRRAETSAHAVKHRQPIKLFPAEAG
jgi:hypothetical protein